MRPESEYATAFPRRNDMPSGFCDRPPPHRSPMKSYFGRFILRPAVWLALTFGVMAAVAQPAATISPDNVTFFSEPNFKGEALAVEAGASVDNLDQMQRANQKSWAFAISSIRVEGAATATIFNGPGFTGDRLEVTRSIPDLYTAQRGGDGTATWDRSIASLSVATPQRAVAMPPAPAPRPGPSTPPPPPPTPAPTRQEQRPTTVVIVPPPPPPPPPPPVVIMRESRPRLDRRTAEAMINRAFRQVLNRPADPDGMRTYLHRLMNEGWTERQMIEQLQRSSEARGTNADEAINKAFREVLGRDADPNGLAHYRAKWRNGWTQGQIREDLRRSQEGARATVIRAYREVLGRDPDPAGLATYTKAIRERGWSDRELRQTLMSGDEYRQKQRGKR